MKSKFTISVLRAVCLSSIVLACSSYAQANLTVEEQRVPKAQKAMMSVFDVTNSRTEEFNAQLQQARNYTALTQVILRHGQALWRESVKLVSEHQVYDDRSLYWARLNMLSMLKQSKAFLALLPMQQEKLIARFERLTRGQQDVKFNQGADKKILITGFDPFFLDRNIKQSNPSGITALALDDILLTKDGVSAEIQALMIPVRFADFDQGFIEELLAPYMRDVDMVVTISMGRTEFDLERYPGLRRSAKAPDNLNVYTGASKENPLIPTLGGKPLSGPEFVQFSLPVRAMKKATGVYEVVDNHEITTIQKGQYKAKSLSELTSQTSVEGSGGGYLSNEISYRSILLRNSHNPILPVGHIHTPRIKGVDAVVSKDIAQQIKQMLTQAISEI